MYSSISPPQLSPNCFIPQACSFGLNDEMNFTSMPMFHHYFTTPLIPPSSRTTPSTKLMLSPKSTPTKTHQPNDQLNEPRRRKQSSLKKDRNCKIVTAHGLRDRRVRLSMDIARRFFDLQDLLGFDTASKTLDWLLTESRTAIKELQTEPGNAKQSEAYVNEDSLVMNNNSTFCTKKRVVQSSQVEDKEEGFAQKNYCVKSLENKSAKEVRAKARARARAREIMPADPPHDYSEPSVLLQPIKSCKTCESELFCFCLLNGIAQSEETFENNLGTVTTVITKKLKPSTVTSDNLEMNSCNTLFCSNNMICSSGDLQEIFGGIQQ